MALVSLDTGESRRVSLPGRSGTGRLDLAWSPGERYFAYVDALNFGAQVGQILVLGVQDAKTAAVTDGRTNVWSPIWSSDGRYLYYVSNRGGSMDLWRQRMRDDKPVGDPQPVTTGVGLTSAAFSPDGAKLAYSKGRRLANVWRVPIFPDRPATWADAQQVTFDEAFVETLDVSPDGQRLVVSTDRSGNPDLWVLPAGGGTMQQVTTDPSPDWAPRWSPDGKEIAFYAYRRGNRQIWVQPLGGGAARQITRSEVGSTFPDWSPDGQEIAFYSPRSGNEDIWVVSTGGGETRQVTDHPAQDVDPAWSPDGDWLAFSSDREGRFLLWRVPSKGGEPKKLSDVEGSLPRWSPDGKWIYFLGLRGSAGNLWVVPSAGGRARQITDLAGRRGMLGYAGFATDGRYLYFWWQEGVGDIWAMDVGYK